MPSEKALQIAVLPGDGIGVEVTREACQIVQTVARETGRKLSLVEAPIGGVAVDQTGSPFPPETEAVCLESDAVLLGAVGGPRWDEETVERRPETGLLQLRRRLGVFANIRPVRLSPNSVGWTPLRDEVVRGGVDLVIVRELTGGLYYGPRGREGEGPSERAFDTMEYRREEVERLVRVGFELASLRRRRVTSVDKSNVLESSRLWRQVAEEVARDYPGIALDHLYVDNAAMQLVRDPSRFDIIVTENTFGDILSDLGAALVGSLGLLPSASLGPKDRPFLYEPVHGSAPDIAGTGSANPLGAIACVALMLKHSFGWTIEAEAVESAVDHVLSQGPWTPDLVPAGRRAVGTKEVGEAVAERVVANLRSRSKEAMA